MNVVAAGSLTMMTDASDFCRYTRSRFDMWWGTLLGKVGGGCFAAVLGAYGAAATLGKTANVFEVVSGLSTGWFALLAVSDRHRPRQLDDQRPQPLHRRAVALEHVRAAGAVLDDGHHQHARHRAVGDAQTSSKAIRPMSACSATSSRRSPAC